MGAAAKLNISAGNPDGMVKPFYIERSEGLSLLLLLLGILLTAGSIISFVTGMGDGWGGWGYWMIAIGIVLLAVGLLWIVKILVAARKFYEMLGENSKAAFIKRLDELEYTAWKLPSRYEAELLEKKREFRLK